MARGSGQGDVDDPGVGVLLTVAGWTGGGVVSAIAFEASRAPVTTGPFPTAHPMDSFFAVVAGCLLVGPLVAGVLLWRWRQPRMVGTVVALSAVAVVGAVPLTAAVSLLLAHGAALAGILLFVGGWGIALPAATRLAVVRATSVVFVRDFDDRPGATPTALVAGPAPSPELVAVGVAGPPVDPTLPPVLIPRGAEGPPR